jgi:hypothetical protein
VSKAKQFLERVEMTPQDPVRKWISWTFKDMDLPVERVRFYDGRVEILTKTFNIKKFNKIMTDYAGEDADPKKTFGLLAQEELKGSKPKNISADLDNLSYHTELVNDDQVQSVVSFKLEY